MPPKSKHPPILPADMVRMMLGDDPTAIIGPGVTYLTNATPRNKDQVQRIFFGGCIVAPHFPHGVWERHTGNVVFLSSLREQSSKHRTGWQLSDLMEGDIRDGHPGDWKACGG